MTDSRALLGRLLGPGERELSCEQCFERLDHYVELELEHGQLTAEHEVPGMRPHLDGCAACGEDYLSLRALVMSER